MFKIGDFSRFSRVSIKMLRHYDEIGLLKPAHVDHETGYRYYLADQLPRLNRIITLKDLGFSLEQIVQLLADDLSVDELRGMLKLKRAEAQRRLQAEEQRIKHIETQLIHLENEAAVPAYDIVLREIPTQTCATIRATLPEMNGTIARMFEQTEKHIAQYRARATKPPMMLFHDAGYDERELDIEVAVPVSTAIPATNNLTIRDVAGCESMACTVHTGEYTGIGQAVTALMGWIDTHDYTVDGPLREVYLRFSADEQGYSIPSPFRAYAQHEFVTELQIPVKRR